MHSCSVIVCHDKLLSATVAFVMIIAIACVVWLGFLSGITVVGSFLCGIVWMRLLKQGRVEVPDLLRPRLGKKLSHIRNTDVQDNAMFPWRGLKIPQEVDQSLETLLDGVLQEYVDAWYKQVSGDQLFIHELRLVLRHLLASLYRRAAMVDLVRLITGPVTRAGLSHLDCYLRSRDAASGASDHDRFVLGCFGSQMHVALVSRDAELQYLRLLTESLLKRLLPERYLKCRSACALLRELLGGTLLLKAMDVIADPDIVNHLLLLFLDKTPMVQLPLDSSPPVEFLRHFSTPRLPPKLVAQSPPELQTVLRDDTMHDLFVRFLQEENAEHLLDFYVALGKFHLQILNPDLSSADRAGLHDHATTIFNEYIADQAPCRVPLSPGVAEEVRSILSRGADGIVELQTTTPFYRASDSMYTLLEEVLFPLFLESDKYFELVCKARSTISEARRTHDRTPDKTSKGAKLKKLRDVLWAATDDGLEEEPPSELGELAEPAEEPTLRVGNTPADARLRDLSAWRVSIPNVETRVDMQHRHYLAFVIEVQRIDVGNGDSPEDLHWSVARRHHEFYVLEAKLLEFHGELPVAPLPPRRSPARQQQEACRARLEKYLQDLLTVPPLRGSELLYSFLRLDAEFTTGILQDIRLGRMIRTVPLRLLKEKGQHLELFLQTFLSSTQPAPPRPRVDLPDAPRHQTRSRWNLPPQRVSRILRPLPKMVKPWCQAETLYDVGIYLAEALFRVAPWMLRLMRALAPLLRRSVQGVTERYLKAKLEQALAPGRVALLINLLGEAVLGEDTPRRTAAEKTDRALETRMAMKQFLPELLVKLLGARNHGVAVETIFEAVQLPLLNKQLSYMLLDIVVEELFPELKEGTA